MESRQTVLDTLGRFLQGTRSVSTDKIPIPTFPALNLYGLWPLIPSYSRVLSYRGYPPSYAVRTKMPRMRVGRMAQ